MAQGVSVGYFDQHLAGVSDDDDVVDAIRPKHKQFLTQQRRDLLGRFGISGDTQLQKVGKLSGGERSRAALARLAAADANFLVLDEPTNHLDLWARDALERAIADFDGTVLFVSHDRYFVNRVADHLIIFEPGGVRVIEGNYEAYQLFLKSKDASEEGPPSPPSKAKVKTQGKQHAKPALAGVAKADGKSNGDGAARRDKNKHRRFPYRKVSDIEADIFQRETRIEELNEEMGDQATYRDGGRVRAIKQEITEQQLALKKLYEHWEEASEMNW